MEMVCFRKKKKDKISLVSKLLTKLMRDVGNSNNGNLFMQKLQTRTVVFKGFQMPLLRTASRVLTTPLLQQGQERTLSPVSSQVNCSSYGSFLF